MIDVGAVAVAVGFSAATGLFSACTPRTRASRLDPVEALKAE